MKKYLSVILAGVFMFACSPPDPSISSSIETLEIGETYPEHVVKINSNFANLNNDKLEDSPSDGETYGRKDGAWAIVPAGGGGAVDSVFGRTGAVVAVGTDYGSFYEVLLTCTDGQIKKWDGSAWTCGTDETGSGSMPPGNAVNDIMQWDGSAWAVQGFINGLIDDTAGDGDTTAVLSASEINSRIAAVDSVPDGGTTGQVLSKASSTDQDLAWVDQTGGSGGVTSIVAGTNITIDPASGLGDVTINASSSAVGGYVPVPSNSDSPCTEGQYAIDRANDYLYWCYATNSWDRVPSTFDQWDNPSTVFYNLSISPTPVNGRVTEPVDNSNINCGTGGNDCDHDYEDGTDVVLHSIADSGYELDAWSGTGLTDNGDGTATVHVGQDISDVTATFKTVAAPSFVHDTFTEASDTLIVDHTGETGATWTAHSSYSTTAGNMKIRAAIDALDSNGSYETLAYASGSPSSADYSVTVEFETGASNPGSGRFRVVGRVDTAADSFYFFQYDYSDNYVKIVRRLSGSNIDVGSTYALTWGTSETHTLKLEMDGTSIKGYVDGTERCSGTNSDITAAGKAGIFIAGSDQTMGAHANEITATDI